MNHTTGANHWLLIKLMGSKSNADGLGAQIKVTTSGSAMQYNHATTSVGYSSSSDKRVHFGLGAAATIDKIEVSWPRGLKQTLNNVRADRILTLREADAKVGGTP